MKTMTLAALAVLTIAGATTAHAQRGNRSEPTIPSQFHGRWAKNQAACRPEHFTTVVTIDRRGWSSFEEGGTVARVGQVRRGTHYFRVDNFAGADETRGSLAMRRVGPRIVMTFQDDGAQPVHYTMVRCR